MLKGKIKEESQRVTSAEFRPGFEVRVRYLPMQKLNALRKKCTRIVFDPKTHQKKEEVNDEKFDTLFAEAVVEGWNGLTPDVLREMIEMEEYPTEEVPFSVEDCIELSKNVYGFSNFLWTVASEFEMHEQARKEAEKKISSHTPVESSAPEAPAVGVLPHAMTANGSLRVDS